MSEHDDIDTTVSKQFTEDLHLVPASGGHDLLPLCWCQPQLNYRDPVTGFALYVHKTTREARN